MNVITANGQSVETRLPCTVQEFLVAQNLPPRSVVVEHKARCWPPGSNLSLRIQHRLLELHERQPARRKEALIAVLD